METNMSTTRVIDYCRDHAWRTTEKVFLLWHMMSLHPNLFLVTWDKENHAQWARFCSHSEENRSGLISEKKAALFRLRVSSLRNEGTQEHLSPIMWSKINVSSPCWWASGKNRGWWLHHSCHVMWTCLLPKVNQNEQHYWDILSK